MFRQFISSLGNQSENTLISRIRVWMCPTICWPGILRGSLNYPEYSRLYLYKIRCIEGSSEIPLPSLLLTWPWLSDLQTVGGSWEEVGDPLQSADWLTILSRLPDLNLRFGAIILSSDPGQASLRAGASRLDCWLFSPCDSCCRQLGVCCEAAAWQLPSTEFRHTDSRLPLLVGASFCLVLSWARHQAAYTQAQ